MNIIYEYSVIEPPYPTNPFALKKAFLQETWSLSVFKNSLKYTWIQSV